MWLYAREHEYETRQVFADTGHEHPLTYAYLDYLETKLGPIQRVKPDFSARIAAKADFVRKHWFRHLTDGKPGKWVYRVGLSEHAQSTASKPTEPPSDPYRPSECGPWLWRSAIPAIPAVDARARVDLALSVLKPTGNPFLDLCILKGRFPSPKGRFCTDELKTIPITEQVVIPILKSGIGVRSWQGVRRAESRRRATYNPHEQIDLGVWVYRPILNWSADDVFAMHRRHGIKANPLYTQGMGRVGCMPCVMCRKGELANISRRFPDVIQRLADWEQLVSWSSKRGSSTFFDVRPLTDDVYGVHYSTHGVHAATEWSRTERGGKQFDLLADYEPIPSCSSHYGLCEISTD